MTDIAELGLAVRSDGVVVAKNRLKDLRQEAGLTEKAVAGLIRQAAALVGAYASWQIVTNTVGKFVQATIDAEAADRRLETVIKSTGGAAGLTTKQLGAMADALEQLTTFDGEAIKGAEAVLLTYGRISKDVFPDALKATLDLSEALGINLNQAAEKVGKSLDLPSRGMTSLAENGFFFTKQQIETAKRMEEVGKIAEAQRFVLDELKFAYGGAAEAARGTLGGALKALQNAFDNLFEVNGPESEQLRKSVESVIDKLTDPSVVQAVQGLGVALLNAFNNALPTIIEVINKITRFFQEMDARANDPSLKGLRDAGTPEAAMDVLTKKLNEKRYSVPMPAGWGDMGEFFKPFNTPAEDPFKPGGPPVTPPKLPSNDQFEAGEKYQKLIDKTNAHIESLKAEAEALNLGTEAAMNLTNTQKLLQEAEDTGVSLTDDVVKKMTELAQKTTDAQLTLEGLQMTLSNASPIETFGKQVEKLNALLDKGKISAGTYGTEIGKAAESMVSTYAAGANDVLGNIEKLTDAMGLEGKRAFEVQKALGIARAVVSGAESVTHSFNAGAAIGGPPLGFVFAGIAAAATAAQIAALASTSYQSKSVPSATGGSSASATQATEPVVQRRTGINVTLLGGGRYSREEVLGLITDINEAVGDGAQIKVAGA